MSVIDEHAELAFKDGSTDWLKTARRARARRKNAYNLGSRNTESFGARKYHPEVIGVVLPYQASLEPCRVCRCPHLQLHFAGRHTHDEKLVVIFGSYAGPTSHKLRPACPRDPLHPL